MRSSFKLALEQKSNFNRLHFLLSISLYCVTIRYPSSSMFFLTQLWNQPLLIGAPGINYFLEPWTWSLHCQMVARNQELFCTLFFNETVCLGNQKYILKYGRGCHIFSNSLILCTYNLNSLKFWIKKKKCSNITCPLMHTAEI